MLYQPHIVQSSSNQYSIHYDRLLGQGMYGRVYLASDAHNNIYACKVTALDELLKQVDLPEDQKRLIQRLTQEVQIMIKRYAVYENFSKHANIVQYIDHCQIGDKKYLISEYCDGETLEKLLSKGRVPEAVAFPWIASLADGLNYIHQQKIVHRDIKPSNIMFSKGSVKIIDFGFAKTLTQDMTVGTGAPQYMAPELLDLNDDYDQKVDIWALGITSYQMLFGTTPWPVQQARSLQEIYNIIMENPKLQLGRNGVQLSDKMNRILKGMLAVDPEERFDSQQLLQQFQS